jgi:hypothetical protein
MSNKLTIPALIAVMLYPAGALADEAGTGMFSFNGFGTLGVVHSSDDRADFTASNYEPNGAGYTRGWSPTVDSLIGGQVTATFTPQLSAVVQLIAQQNYNDTYWPHVEWANIKYQFNPDVDVRIGRIVQPSFMVSDSRRVGYTTPWVRPPTEVYSVNPVTYLDGVDASYRLHRGAVTSTLQADYGKDLSFQFPAGDHLDASSAWGIFDNTEYGAALLHLGYVHATITLHSPADALFDDFRQFGPQGIAIAQAYEVVDKFVTLLSIGASYDSGQWLGMGEWVRSRSDSLIGVSSAWYVSGGYRVGHFTPYVTYAQVTSRITAAAGLNSADLPASVAPLAAALNSGLDAAIASRPAQYTSSVGVRWDFMKDFDLKLQFDRINLGAGSDGTLINIQPGFQPGSTLYLFSAALDFVF